MDTEIKLMFGLVALPVVLGLIGLFAIAQDHSVKNYQMGNSRHSSGYCIEANVPWAANYTAFCSDDINKTIDIMERLNK